jgi:hypothetical protein
MRSPQYSMAQETNPESSRTVAADTEQALGDPRLTGAVEGEAPPPPLDLPPLGGGACHMLIPGRCGGQGPLPKISIQLRWHQMVKSTPPKLKYPLGCASTSKLFI